MHPQPSIQESRVNLEGLIYNLFFLVFTIFLCNDKLRILQGGCVWCRNRGYFVKWTFCCFEGKGIEALKEAM
jgi:hypothetical protein